MRIHIPPGILLGPGESTIESRESELRALSRVVGDLDRQKRVSGLEKPRRGFGTRRCSEESCDRTISANKASCLAHSIPE